MVLWDIDVEELIMTEDEIKKEIVVSLIAIYFKYRKTIKSPIESIFDFDAASEEMKEGFCAGIQSCAMAIDNTMDKPILSEYMLYKKLDS